MKKSSLFMSLFVLISSITLDAQIRVDSNGNVGVGVTPSIGTKFETTSAFIWGTTVFKPSDGCPIWIWSNPYPHTSIYPGSNNYCNVGIPDQAFKDIYCYNLTELSDARQKENVREITDPLDIVLKLKGIEYDLKKEYAYNDTISKDSKERAKRENERKNIYGFLAQDVSKILPEVVNHDDSTDVYGIHYTRIIPILVEAMKEQQIIIENLQSEIQELKENDDNTLKSASVSDNSTNVDNLSENILYQNIPNPFSASTTIRYFLLNNINNAMINIYNMNGVQLKSIELHQTGEGTVEINGGEFDAGMYLYTLIADGQIIDTKKMVLTD